MGLYKRSIRKKYCGYCWKQIPRFNKYYPITVIKSATTDCWYEISIKSILCEKCFYEKLFDKQKNGK